MTQRQIAIYGKGGIGKSTISSNVAAAMALLGKRVMLVGCDPKQDTTMGLSGGLQLRSVLECLNERGEGNFRLEDICFEGPHGIVLVESGGPEPGIGCAGRGVITALQILEQMGAFKQFGIDVVIYDVLGDVVCGGFAMPLRAGYAREIYVVTSGELMALYAANNICKAVQRFASGVTRIGLGGLILNKRNVPFEEEIVTTMARQIEAPVVIKLPRDNLVQMAEASKDAVVFYDPESELAQHFTALAKHMLTNENLVIPKPITREQLTELMSGYDVSSHERPRLRSAASQ